MNYLDTLIECIKAQNNLLEEFIEALQEENSALLADPSNELLISITTKKNDYAARLDKLDKSRTRNLNQLGFKDSQDGVREAIGQFPILELSFARLWELVEIADEINRENGTIISTFMEHNQRAMNTLKSLMEMDLYDASGKFKSTNK